MTIRESLLDPRDLYLVAATAISYGVFLAGQLALMRALKDTSALKILLACCVAGGALLLGLAFARPGAELVSAVPETLAQTVFGALAAEFVFAVLCFNYVIGFFNLGETARRIRMLREIQNAGGSLTLASLLEHYNGETILNVRLGRLVRSGQVVRTEAGYRIASPVVLLQAKIIWTLKRILNIPEERI